MLAVIDKFRPGTTLNTDKIRRILRLDEVHTSVKFLPEDEFLIAKRHKRINSKRLHLIYFAQRSISNHCDRLSVRRILIPVKIQGGTRGKHHVLSFVCRLGGIVLSSVRIYQSALLKIVPCHFIPAGKFPALGCKISFNLFNHIALQILIICNPFPFHQRIAGRTHLPGILPRLVSTNVYIFRREQFHHFIKNIEIELIYSRISRTEFAVNIRPAGAAEFRMRYEYSIRMCRKLDFRYYRNMVLFSTRKNLPDIILGIISAISSRCTFIQISPVLVVPPFPPVSLGAEGSLRGKFRISVKLQTPATIVCEMQVETVELVTGHLMNNPEDFLFRKEVTRDIYVNPPVRKSRTVFYIRTRNSLCTDHLGKGLHGIEHSPFFRSPDHYSGWAYSNFVALLLNCGEAVDNHCNIILR